MKIRYVKFVNPIRRGAFSVEPKTIKDYRFADEDEFGCPGFVFSDEAGAYFVPMTNVACVMIDGNPFAN